MKWDIPYLRCCVCRSPGVGCACSCYFTRLCGRFACFCHRRSGDRLVFEANLGGVGAREIGTMWTPRQTNDGW